jgi:hypothetical protein
MAGKASMPKATVVKRNLFIDISLVPLVPPSGSRDSGLREGTKVV